MIALNLSKQVEELLAEAKTHLGAISEQERMATEIVVALRDTKRLTAPEETALKQTQRLAPGKFRSTAIGRTLWPNGATIRISFMDGSKIMRAKVEKVAKEWTKYANIQFEFGKFPDADVRISFKDSGAWSYRGTEALAVSADRPTINFGWFANSTPDTEYARVVLKEFGHMLGLINEHQNPNATIPWNKDAVYRDLMGPPNSWTKEQVDKEVFGLYEKADLPDYREFDPQSVMMFELAPAWTDGKLKTQSKTKLSEGDKKLIAKLYPPE